VILSAQSIRKRLRIQPFHERAVSNGRTFGLSGCGYDVRLAQTLWVWPLWGRLGSIIEHLSIPDDLCAEVKDKSTNARRFITVQNTIIEPGWHGYLTVEITHHRPWPVRIRAGTPIAQIVFKQLDEPTAQPYRGRYQGQSRGPQKARMATEDTTL
jgi:dCTP deaminase